GGRGPDGEGFEGSSRHVCVLGTPEKAEAKSLFLRSFPPKLWVLPIASGPECDTEELGKLADANIEYVSECVVDVRADGDDLIAVLAGGREIRMDVDRKSVV